MNMKTSANFCPAFSCKRGGRTHGRKAALSAATRLAPGSKSRNTLYERRRALGSKSFTTAAADNKPPTLQVIDKSFIFVKLAAS